MALRNVELSAAPWHLAPVVPTRTENPMVAGLHRIVYAARNQAPTGYRLIVLCAGHHPAGIRLVGAISPTLRKRWVALRAWSSMARLVVCGEDNGITDSRRGGVKTRINVRNPDSSVMRRLAEE